MWTAFTLISSEIKGEENIEGYGIRGQLGGLRSTNSDCEVDDCPTRQVPGPGQFDEITGWRDID